MTICKINFENTYASEKNSITMAFMGDVMLGHLVNQTIHIKGYEYPWGDDLSIIKNADLSFINLECVIAKSGERWHKTPKVFFFRANPVVINALNLAGIDCVTLANNHTMDFQEKALFETIELLDRNNIAHAGAGRDINEASKPALIEAKGIKVGIVAFTDSVPPRCNEPDFSDTESSPGTNYIPITTDEKIFNRVKSSIATARNTGASIVVFSIHWGPNMRESPPDYFRTFAHAVIDAGADIFHGHSAHIFQGIEIYKHKPIMYDTGDFIDDYYVGVEKNDQQLLYMITTCSSGIERFELIPVLISECQVNKATGEIFDEIFERIKTLSNAMGTEVLKRGSKLEIVLH
ncbi:MAG: CapA family protein [Candidatus Scalinduaceae bacterium]